MESIPLNHSLTLTPPRRHIPPLGVTCNTWRTQIRLKLRTSKLTTCTILSASIARFQLFSAKYLTNEDHGMAEVSGSFGF